MIVLKILIVLTVGTYASADYCQDNFTLADFPEAVLHNVISIIKGQMLPLSDCSKTVVKDSSINLWYWNRQNLVVPILLDKTNPSQLDINKPTVILVPGWLCSVKNDRMPELRSAYLNRYDCNVIALDWEEYSVDLYGDSYCSVPLIAKIVGKFLCESKLDLNNVHILGHSMGGHLAGFVGKEAQKQCGKTIKRITGLDPAGPLFQFQQPSKRLDASDAKTVDVIHTNQGGFGYFGSCGTVDFYPNCGIIQPGCLNLTSLALSGLMNLPLKEVNCNHVRSLDYMIESIASDNFVAKSSKIPSLCVPDILHSTAIMGEGCTATNKDDKYILKTNRIAPYAKK